VSRAGGVLAVVLVVAALSAGGAGAARKATPVETKAIDAAVQAHWCSYLPKGYGPCSAWKVKITVKHVSTFVHGWALAQLDATGPHPMTTTFAPFQNVFLHERADGSWQDRGWFDSLVYRSCKAAAKGTKVPESVLDDFGLCDRLIITLGG
jgi:hypothetical protein